MKYESRPIGKGTVQPKREEGLADLLEDRKLILASSSPRRADILRRASVSFEIKVPPNLNEESSSSHPAEHVLALSRLKATSVANQLKEGIILGADTIVVLDGRILGKPKDQKEAFAILKKLSARTHTVYTGVTLVNKHNGKVISDYDSTQVTFNRLDEKQILSYVETAEPMDKAGAYGIQGMGSFLVQSIQGSLNNVIGLPTELLKRMLPEIV
jgi:septum formation protein